MTLTELEWERTLSDPEARTARAIASGRRAFHERLIVTCNASAGALRLTVDGTAEDMGQKRACVLVLSNGARIDISGALDEALTESVSMMVPTTPLACCAPRGFMARLRWLVTGK